MEEYLQEQRRAYDFSAANLAAAAAATYERNFSPENTMSSVSSQDFTDFVSDFKNAYASLHHNTDGMLTIDELGEVLYLLDQEPTEAQLSEMFSELDTDKQGTVAVDHVVSALNARLREAAVQRYPLASSRSYPSSDKPSSQLGHRAYYTPMEGAAASAIEAAHNTSRASSASSELLQGNPAAELRKARERKWSSQSSRKKSPMVLWWGFQDLADTI